MVASTLPELYRPMMGAPDIETPVCAICGRRYPLNRHHIVKRSAGKLFGEDGKEVKKPTVVLCGMGNTSGCHGLAHQGKLHFRWVGHWEYRISDEAVKYQDALGMDGWVKI